ncbi:MAG: hypothetical protein ACLFWG_00270 [Longimicrobiales bacterium]
MSTDTTTTTRITYPDASALDTHGLRSGDALRIYFVPTREGGPEIALHHSIGGSSVPMPAVHGRWVWIGDLRPDTVGASALDALRSLDGLLASLDVAYPGSRWDGSDRRVRGSDEWLQGTDELRAAWAEAAGALGRYWDAADWLQYDDLADVLEDPEAVLRDGWEAVIRDAADELAAGARADGHHVAASDLREVLTEWAEEHREVTHQCRRCVRSVEARPLAGGNR